MKNVEVVVEEEDAEEGEDEAGVEAGVEVQLPPAVRQTIVQLL